VAFLVATLVLSDSMRGRAASDIAEAFTGTAAVVQGVELGEPGGGPGDPARSVRQSLGPGITERVVAIDGVDDAASQWVAFAKLVVDGSSVGTGTASDVGRNWVANPALNPFQLSSGRPPTAVGEIVIDRSLAGFSSSQKDNLLKRHLDRTRAGGRQRPGPLLKWPPDLHPGAISRSSNRTTCRPAGPSARPGGAGSWPCLQSADGMEFPEVRQHQKHRPREPESDDSAGPQ
jgi:hypothetical protein